MMVSKAAFMAWARRLPGGALWAFGLRQAWAALFGGLLLAGIVATRYITLPWLPRYDWLLLYALGIQLILLATRLERPHEVLTIALFHLVGLGMELFKTSGAIGAWSYPEASFIRLGGVPLFSGFMYAAVGSYIARAWRVLHLSFERYPQRVWTILLAVAIYANFFTHHFVIDIRPALFAAILVLFGRTRVGYVIDTRTRRMPLVAAFILIALFIWLAENISTYAGIWLYPEQIGAWRPVGVDKLGAWLLLMVISFIMIDLLHSLRARRKLTPAR